MFRIYHIDRSERESSRRETTDHVLFFKRSNQKRLLHSLGGEAGETEGEERIWWWYPHWIPLASFGNGDLLCVEVDPTSGGQFGQIIEFWHETYSLWVAPNFQARYDLDMANYSLVKSYENGKHGTTYPDMPWEPKESFKAVAEYYAAH